MTTVLFTRREYQYTVQFAYNATIVELLKATVPSYARSWDRPARMWTVDTDWCRPLAAVLHGIGCTVIGLDDTARQVRETKTWAHSLFCAVGPSRVAVVHRALTKVLHPDNHDTGCTTLQRELKDARAELDL